MGAGLSHDEIAVEHDPSGQPHDVAEPAVSRDGEVQRQGRSYDSLSARLEARLLDDDGLVRIYAENGSAKDAAVARIEEITAEAEVGRIYHGKVERIVDFGAFISILPGKDGLLHISQIAEERVEKVTDYLSEGEEVEVVCLDVDQRGRIKLSIKELPKYQDDSGAEEAAG